MTAYERQKLYRNRQRQGLCVIPVTIRESSTVEWLIASGRLSEAAALDAANVATALATFIQESCR